MKQKWNCNNVSGFRASLFYGAVALLVSNAYLNLHRLIMGGAIASANHGLTPDQESYAFKVFHFDMQNGTLAEEQSLSKHDTEASSNHQALSDADLHDWVVDIFQNAVVEKDIPILECKHPAVIRYKYSLLSDEEKKEFNDAVLAAAVGKDKKTHKAQNKKPADYSKSFGGTEADTKNEQEAAAILRGESGGSGAAATNEEAFAALNPPNMPHPAQHNALRKAGKWMKFLSLSGCYLYLHPLTRDMVAIRPEDYEEDAGGGNNGQGVVEEKDPANGLPKVFASDLPQEVDRIVKELKKTPLIIDTTENQVARIFYSFKGYLEDASCLSVPFGKSGIKKEDIMERCRKRLVGALKHGSIFVLYLGGVTIEHADIKGKLCKKVR